MKGPNVFYSRFSYCRHCLSGKNKLFMTITGKQSSFAISCMRNDWFENLVAILTDLDSFIIWPIPILEPIISKTVCIVVYSKIMIVRALVLLMTISLILLCGLVLVFNSMVSLRVSSDSTRNIKELYL